MIHGMFFCGHRANTLQGQLFGVTCILYKSRWMIHVLWAYIIEPNTLQGQMFGVTYSTRTDVWEQGQVQIVFPKHALPNQVFEFGTENMSFLSAPTTYIHICQHAL